jgi:UDP-N-acetylmuramoyl-L-alanyl-D-glutamate--2,6-diaminopimelate ligase
MEVSSHALSQRRVAGVEYDAVCFTNIRRDHLDFHGSLVNYRRAKARLLEHLSPDGVVVLNADEPEVVQVGAEAFVPAMTVGMKKDADVMGLVVERHKSEQTFLLSHERESVPVRTRMIGDHHVYNCLCAAGLGVALGVDLPTIARGLEAVECVPGRMERIECGQPFGVFVDYAHTPDALATALLALREVTEGRVICVFGAGGERDALKRPAMGAAVEHCADLAAITTDNPRSEAPAAIARDILAGFNRPSLVEQIPDRAEAIRWAIYRARPGDTVLIAGKGHEGYQLVGQRRFHFDDRKVAREILYAAVGDQRSAISFS